MLRDLTDSNLRHLDPVIPVQNINIKYFTTIKQQEKSVILVETGVYIYVFDYTLLKATLFLKPVLK